MITALILDSLAYIKRIDANLKREEKNKQPFIIALLNRSSIL